MECGDSFAYLVDRFCQSNHQPVSSCYWAMITNPDVLVPAVSRVILLQTVAAGLLSFRVMAIIALCVVIAVFIWGLRHLRKIEKTIVADDLIPVQRGARNNMILMMCA